MGQTERPKHLFKLLRQQPDMAQPASAFDGRYIAGTRHSIPTEPRYPLSMQAWKAKCSVGVIIVADERCGANATSLKSGSNIAITARAMYARPSIQC